MTTAELAVFKRALRAGDAATDRLAPEFARRGEEPPPEAFEARSALDDLRAVLDDPDTTGGS